MLCLAGFILKARDGEGDSTPDDITAMVKAQITPPHRSAQMPSAVSQGVIAFRFSDQACWCGNPAAGVVGSGNSFGAGPVAQADSVPAAEQRGMVQLPVVRLIPPLRPRPLST